jgi:transposase
LGYGLHRELVALGVHNLVVQPVCLDEHHKGVNHDKSDAKELALRPDRYVSGNSHALATVRVPSPEEERKRCHNRQREQLKREVQRVAAQGRSLLLTQGWREKRGWWERGRWSRLRTQLPAWLVARLEVFRRVLQTLRGELDTLSAALEAAAPARRPKGLGG